MTRFGMPVGMRATMGTIGTYWMASWLELTRWNSNYVNHGGNDNII
jgi:hypothetical protein